VIPKRVPGKFADQAVILVAVIALVRKDQVRRPQLFQRLDDLPRPLALYSQFDGFAARVRRKRVALRASAARAVLEHNTTHVTSIGRSTARRSRVAPQPISISSQCARHSTRSAHRV
jgi:hypothetical protein